MAPSNPYTTRFPRLGPSASVAQLAEQLICNQQVAGSTPAASSARPDGRRQPRGRRRPTGRDTPGPKQTRKTITGTRHTTRHTLRPGAASTARHEPLDSRTTHHKKPHEGDHGRHPPTGNQPATYPPASACEPWPAGRQAQRSGAGGEFPERSKGSDCKSDGLCLRRFESCTPHFPPGRSTVLAVRQPQAQAGRGGGGATTEALTGAVRSRWAGWRGAGSDANRVRV